jgi:protein-S-isoprenylcysteine O-methyltransferase Ste14
MSTQPSPKQHAVPGRPIPSHDGQDDDDDDDDDDEKPLSNAEIAKFALFIIMYPFVLGPFLLIGAFLRTAPAEFPPPFWFGFWLSLFTMLLGSLIVFAMLWDRPRVLRERMRRVVPNKNDTNQERRFFKLYSWTFLLGMVFMTWDAVGRRDEYPRFMNFVGCGAMVASSVMIAMVFRTNKYASRVVYAQEGQELIVTGPYSIVRHPMYFGLIPMFFGFSLCAGSFWGLIPMGVGLALVGYRTFDEEAFLVQTFGSKYEDYQEKVKYRMVPGIF